MIDHTDLRALAMYAVALLLGTLTVLWAAGMALLVRWLWVL